MALGKKRTDATTQAPEEVIGNAFPGTTPVEQQQVATRPVDELPQEIAAQPSTYDRDALRELNDFDAAVAMATAAHGPIDDASDLGDGFALLKDDGKGRLVNVPLLFMEWSFYPGDFGSQFVAARVMARNPDGGISKYIVNDGSTGICDQLAAFSKRTGKYGGLLAKRGLRVSDYSYCEMCAKVQCDNPDSHRAMGKHKRAETYYIDTAA